MVLIKYQQNLTYYTGFKTQLLTLLRISKCRKMFHELIFRKIDQLAV